MQAVDGVSFDAARRRGAGGRGRVGLGQVGHRDDADGPDALAQRTLRGHGHLPRHRAGERRPTTSCAGSAGRRSR